MSKTADLFMTETEKESIKNKIAELYAHGLNSREIASYLKKVSKANLVRIIIDSVAGGE